MVFCDRALDGVHHAAELWEDPVACGVDDPATVASGVICRVPLDTVRHDARSHWRVLGLRAMEFTTFLRYRCHKAWAVNGSRPAMPTLSVQFRDPQEGRFLTGKFSGR